MNKSIKQFFKWHCQKLQIVKSEDLQLFSVQCNSVKISGFWRQTTNQLEDFTLCFRKSACFTIFWHFVDQRINEDTWHIIYLLLCWKMFRICKHTLREQWCQNRGLAGLLHYDAIWKINWQLGGSENGLLKDCFLMHTQWGADQCEPLYRSIRVKVWLTSLLQCTMLSLLNVSNCFAFIRVVTKIVSGLIWVPVVKGQMWHSRGSSMNSKRGKRLKKMWMKDCPDWCGEFLLCQCQ